MRLKDLIFPPRCAACAELLPVSIKGNIPMLCPNCERAMKKEMMTQCKECYLPMADCRCVPKIMATKGFAAHLKLLPFSDTKYPTARGLVLHLKQSGDGRYYKALAELLLPSVRAAIKAYNKSLVAAGKSPIKHTVVSFLPRTPMQKRKHGVDQAACLAKAISVALGVKTVPLFRRRGRSLLQKSLSKKERLVNARQSLALARGAGDLDLTDTLVLLVDDLITTGSSMAAAAELLRARALMAVSIAFTPKAEKQ